MTVWITVATMLVAAVYIYIDIVGPTPQHGGKTMPTNNNGPVTMTVDELTNERDIAWQACCWVGDCQWTGEIFHADSYVERGEEDPADAAWGDATEDGREHLEVEHGIVP